MCNSSVSRRKLKVYSGRHTGSYKARPYIRLCGDYLQQMNFSIGDFVEIQIEHSRIVIQKIEPKDFP
jgi:hypothetical protein